MEVILKVKIRSIENIIREFEELSKESTDNYERGLYDGNIQAMGHFLNDLRGYLSILREDKE